MSPQQIVTGKGLITPPYSPGSFVYAVPGNTTNSIDKMRTFDSLYSLPARNTISLYIRIIVRIRHDGEIRSFGTVVLI